MTSTLPRQLVFQDLLTAYCWLTGRMASAQRGMTMPILGVPCSLHHLADAAPDFLIVALEMGEVDEQEQAQAYRELLQQNLTLYDGKSPVFAIDPETDELLCLAHFRLDQLNAEMLHGELIRLARAVREWQLRPASAAEVAEAMAEFA